MIWFTSDTHFNHVNIIKPEYCNRPFSDVNHMNEMLINNWNNVVGPSDTVYHLGDFAMGDKNQIPAIRKRLNGRIVLICGNHDRKKDQVMPQILDAGFDAIADDITITIGEMTIWMRHEPSLEWQPNFDNEYHLCGHVHNSWSRKGSIINVGVDVHNYRPISIHDAILSTESVGKSHRGY
jgi:calcineurin-like phosphoesterase family protein